jgi:single-strand DNA-binding protein
MPIGQTPISITGNLVADPELKFTSQGTAVTTFTVASTEKVFNKNSGKHEDGDTLFLRVNCWRQLAEHVAESAQRGMRVMVTGTLKQRSYETRDGEKRTAYEVQAEDVGMSLQWSTAKMAKAARSQVPPPDDPWAPTAGQADEPPF